MKIKKEKGITLVALIITIVVLLILAVVAIGAITDSNIIAHAQNAASKYSEEQDREVNMLASYESLMDSIMSPWSKLTVPVQFDKRYSNYVTVDGETQYLEITLYSDGRANLFGNEITKEEIVEAVEEGYVKVSSNAIELDGTKFVFSTNGEQIEIYVEGNKIGTLDVEENITSSQTRIYEIKSNNDGEELIMFEIIKSNELYKSIYVQNGEIVYESEEVQIEIKENYTVKIADNIIGTYKYVVIEKDSMADIDGGVSARISDNGKEYYGLIWQTGENNALIMQNWVGPSILNEKLTEEKIYQQYPKAQQ